MAVKTSLQVRTTNPTTNETKLKTATFSNPDATNAQLNSFAQKMYGNAGLSANTVDSVIRVDKQSITNAESDTTPATSNLLSITFNALPEMPNSTNWQSEDVFLRMGVPLGTDSTFHQLLNWTYNTETKKVDVEFVENLKTDVVDEYQTETKSINIFYFLGLNASATTIEVPCTVHDSDYPDDDEETTVRDTYRAIYNTLNADLTVIGMTGEQIVNYVKTGKILKVYAAILNYIITGAREHEEDTYTIIIDFNVSYDETNNALVMTATNDEVQKIGMTMYLAWVFATSNVYQTVLDKYSGTIQDNISYNSSKRRVVFEKSKA